MAGLLLKGDHSLTAVTPAIHQTDASPTPHVILKNLTEAMPGIAQQWITGKQERVFHSALWGDLTEGLSQYSRGCYPKPWDQGPGLM